MATFQDITTALRIAINNSMEVIRATVEDKDRELYEDRPGYWMSREIGNWSEGRMSPYSWTLWSWERHINQWTQEDRDSFLAHLKTSKQLARFDDIAAALRVSINQVAAGKIMLESDIMMWEDRPGKWLAEGVRACLEHRYVDEMNDWSLIRWKREVDSWAQCHRNVFFKYALTMER